MSAGKFTTFNISNELAASQGMVLHRGMWMLPGEIAEYEAWLVKMAREEAELQAKRHRERFTGIIARRQRMQNRHAALPAPVQTALHDIVAAFDNSLTKALAANPATGDVVLANVTRQIAAIEEQARNALQSYLAVEKAAEVAAERERAHVYETALSAAETCLRSMNATEVGVHAPGVREDLMSQLARLRDHRGGPQPTAATDLLDRCCRLDLVVAAGLQAHDEARVTARHALETAEARLADLVAVPGTTTDMREMATARLRPLRVRYDTGDVHDLAPAALLIATSFHDLTVAAMTRASRCQVQSAAAAGLIEALANNGFDVRRQDEADGTIILSAERLTGEGITVRVPREGPARYDTGGFPLRDEVTVSGSPVTTCDEAEDEISRLHEHLALLGVESSPLRWETQDPDRIRSGKIAFRSTGHNQGQA